MVKATIGPGATPPTEGMQDLNDLYLFTVVVERGSFTAAAQAAGLTTSRISRRIGALEERLGVRLLHRTTRKLSLTAIGERYYQHCRAMVSEAAAAAEVVEQTQTSPRGRVRVTCPAFTGQSALGPILTGFMRQYPEVRITLAATDRFIDLIEEGYDVAIRFRAAALEDSSLVARALGESRSYLVASPALLARHGRPAQVEDLLRLPSVGKRRHDTAYNWTLSDARGETRVIPHQPQLEADDWQVIKHAALAGLGVAALPDELCRDEVNAGALAILLPAWQLPSATLHIIYTSRRGLIPAVRAFIDYASEKLGERCLEGGKRMDAIL